MLSDDEIRTRKRFDEARELLQKVSDSATAWQKAYLDEHDKVKALELEAARLRPQIEE